MKTRIFALAVALAASAVPPAHSATFFSFNFVYTNGNYTIGGEPYPHDAFPSGINFPGSVNTNLNGINDLGQIVGTYDCRTCFPVTHGFLYTGGTYSTFDFGTAGTIPMDINNAGQITGFYDPGTFHGFDGFLYSDGQFATISFPGSKQTTPQFINASGQIVGQYDGTLTGTGAFLYSNGAYTDLELPLNFIIDEFFQGDRNIRGIGTSVTGIDDSGQVFGNFLVMTPVPTALPLFATGLGVMGLLAWRRKRNVRGLTTVSGT